MREDVRMGEIKLQKKRMDKGVEYKSRKIRTRGCDGKNKLRRDKSR